MISSGYTFEGFIEIETGYYYKIEDGTPWSCRNLNHSFRNYLKPITFKDKGYFKLQINGKTFGWHRLVFKYFKGYEPVQVDHINNKRDDNRIENLQETNNKANCRKCKKQKHNTSGYAGVSFNNQRQKFQAKIKVDGKTKHLGLFTDPKEAYKVYLEAKIKYHGADSIKPLNENTL